MGLVSDEVPFHVLGSSCTTTLTWLKLKVWIRHGEVAGLVLIDEIVCRPGQAFSNDTACLAVEMTAAPIPLPFQSMAGICALIIFKYWFV